MTRGRWVALAVALVLVAAGVLVGVATAGGTTSAAQDAIDCRRTTARALVGFLGRALDLGRMTAAVDAALHRQKAPAVQTR